MIIRKGIAASPGYGLGNATLQKQDPIVINRIYAVDIELEISSLTNAIKQSDFELNELKKNASNTLKEEEIAIFDSHIAMLNDRLFIDEVISKIKEGFSAQYSYKNITEKYLANFRLIKDDYLKERALDLEEIYKRVISKLLDLKDDIKNPTYEANILVINDLVLSNVAALDKSKYRAIIAKRGSQVSHAAIIARTLGIPTVVGVNINNIKEGDYLIVDGSSGVLIINPTMEEKNKYTNIYKNYLKENKELLKFKNKQTKTLDNHFIKIGININELQDLKFIDYAEEIGLYRTEFMFIKETKMPDEENQTKTYSKVMQSMTKSDVIIRTLDIGGDKKVSYLRQKREVNPFLGNRGLRLTLKHKTMFKKQIKSMLRANCGNLNIMLPMVATKEELLDAKKVIKEAENSLKREGVTIPNYKLGIMVEVPIMAIGLERLIEEIDFVSIGSNDLLQYLFAADRLNDEVNYLYQPYHPEFLQLIKNISMICKKYNKKVSLCGEMAADIYAALILVGLGVDSLSMNYNSILKIRAEIAKYTYTDLVNLADRALKLSTNNEVYELISNFIKEDK